jgi:TM2 domain-containing membrane protein YozV
MGNEIHELAVLKKDLSNEEKMQFDMQYSNQYKNPNTALILSLFFGGLGIDRFYIGDTGKGLVKLFTLGGFIIWTIVDWFLIKGACNEMNHQVANDIKNSLVQMRS